jgi:hypothetical protein
MSQENLEIIRAVVAAVNRGDWDAALSHTAPNLRWDTSRDLNEWRGVYETHEGVRRALEGFWGTWESWEAEIDEFIEVGEDTVVTRQTGYFRVVTEWTHYTELEKALEAAGLSE